MLSFLIYIYLFLQKEELIEVFVQSNFEEETINLILENKLIDNKKNKINATKEIEQKKEVKEEENDNNRNNSWKENKNNDIRYKKPKYNDHYYNDNYSNHSNSLFHHNRKHFKDYKSYKYQYNKQSKRNHFNNKKNYLEKEIEDISEIKTSETLKENTRENSLDSNKNNGEFNNHENTEEVNSSEFINLNLMKSQSEEISYKNDFLFHDIGIKLFPGAFQYNKKKSYEQNDYNNYGGFINDKSIDENKKENDLNLNRTKKDFECNNYLRKIKSNNIKTEQKSGLALAFDYYSSFLEELKLVK